MWAACDHAAMSSSVAATTTAPAVSDSRSRWLARMILGLTIAGILGGAVVSMLDDGTLGFDLLFVSFLLFPLVGYVLAIRRPDNAVSWVMLGVGLALGLSSFMGAYAGYAIHGGLGGHRARRDRGGARPADVDPDRRDPRHVPAPDLSGGPPAVPTLALVRPDPRRRHGRSRSWRSSSNPGPSRRARSPACRTRSASRRCAPCSTSPIVTLIALPIGVIGSLTSLVLRFRRSTGIERLQLRWLVTRGGDGRRSCTPWRWSCPSAPRGAPTTRPPGSRSCRRSPSVRSV